MERIARIGSLMRSAIGSAIATRPALSTDGVDISAWQVAGNQRVPPQLFVHLIGDGTSTGLGNPTGGTTGPEVWSYIPDNTGALKWTLVGFLNGKNPVALAAVAGQSYAEMLTNTVALLGSRIAIAGAPGTGGVVNYYVEGVERDIGGSI